MEMPRQSSGRNTRSKRENSIPIPTDLIFEIFARLPAESIARCLCVSKSWASIIRHPDFIELYFTRSSSKPKILFSIESNNELLFYSSPQSPVTLNYHTKLRFDRTSEICGHIHGLICITHLQTLKDKKETVTEIFNPSLKKSLLLPKLKTTRFIVKTFLVYDPVSKQFKVLSMTWPRYGNKWKCAKHQIITLGNPLWRSIGCNVPHQPAYEGICIDGFLYYNGVVDKDSGVSTIVCFDVGCETFRFIEKDEGVVLWRSTLVNYNGKLATVMSDGIEVTGESRFIEVRILLDVEKHEWSKRVFELPTLWKDVVVDAKLYFAGVTDGNEIVLSSHYGSERFYVFYYDFERNAVRKVEIQGTDGFDRCRVHTFLHYAENVKLFADF